MEVNEIFELCLKLKDAGFPEDRTYGAIYYIRPDMMISVDQIGSLRAPGWTDFEAIFSKLVYEPTLGRIELASREFFVQCVWTTGAGCFAYSNVVNPDAPEGTDPYIRANGETEWEARANLYLAVQAKKNHIVIPPQSLEQSENITIGQDAPDPLPKTLE